MERLRVALVLVLAIATQESLSAVDDVNEPVPSPRRLGVSLIQSVGAASTSASDVLDLKAEVQQLKAQLAKETSARKIADMAALGAMQKEAAEASASKGSGAEACQQQKKDAADTLQSSQAKLSEVRKSAADAKQASEAKLAQAQAALAAAGARADEAEARTEALRSALNNAEKATSGRSGSFGASLRQLPNQRNLAVAGVIVGALSVIGPTSLIDFVFIGAGSIFGGLLLASGFCYLEAVHRLNDPTASSSLRWPDFLDDLTQGRASAAGYAIWFIWALLGIARYMSGCRCQIMKSVPGVRISPSGEVEADDGTSLKAPLMSERREPPRLRPSSDARRRDDDPSLANAGPSGPRHSPPETPRSARSARSGEDGFGGRQGGSGGRILPKPRPSKSTGILMNLKQNISQKVNQLSNGEGMAPGSTHNSGRPGGFANNV